MTQITVTQKARSPVNVNWAMGDSLSVWNGWPLTPDPWPLPQPMQGHGLGGAGFVWTAGGQTIEDVFWDRWNNPTYWPRPSRITLMGGVNDIGNGVSATASFNAASTMRTNVQAVGVRVYMMTEPWWLWNLTTLNASIRSTFPTDLIDLDLTISNVPAYTTDNVHPNLAGQRVIAGIIASVFGP